MTTETIQPLVKARIRRWRDVRSGWLVIGPTKLMVYRRRFMRRPEEAGDFEMEGLRTAEPDTASNSVSLIFDRHQGGPANEMFSFPDVRDFETVVSALSGLLQAAEEERKRREEEAARLEREAEERRRQAREAFAADLWQTCEVVWLLTKAGYTMEYAVIAGDWSDARNQYSAVWRQADRLKSAHGIDLSVPLKELDDNIRAETGEEVIRRTGPLLKALSEGVLQTGALWDKWRKEEIAPSAMSPNWNHLPYFLLFAADHFETVLSSQIEDWAGVSKAVSVLSSSSAVLRECFKIDLDSLLEAAESSGGERNAKMIAETTGQIEDALASAFKARPFEYKDPEPLSDGGHNGSLPE